MAAKLDVCSARMDKRARYRIKDGNREEQMHHFVSFLFKLREYQLDITTDMGVLTTFSMLHTWRTLLLHW